MLVQACYNIVDSAYVSRFAEGALTAQDALTAVSAAFPVQSIMISVSTGTGVGMNAILSRALGAKRRDEASQAANTGVFLAFCSSVVMMAVGVLIARPFYHSMYPLSPAIVDSGTDYLVIVTAFSMGLFMQVTFERMMQGTGLSLHTMVTQMTGAITNIILDPFFIFGIGPFPRMGVAGAAVATVIGQHVAATLAIYLNHRCNRELHVSLREVFHPSLAIIRRIYYVAVPSMIMGSIGSVMYYGMNRILASFDYAATAVFGVYFKLQSFFFMPVFGMNNAIVPIMAYNYGARNPKRILGTLKRAAVTDVIIMTVGLLVFQLLPDLLIGMFNPSDEFLHIGRQALRTISFSFPLAAIGISVSGSFQALGDGIYSTITSLCRQLVALLPAAFLLSLTGNVHMVWWSFPIAEVVSVTVTLILFARIYKQKIKPLTQKNCAE
jgi:putative MATE family efflux protein